MSKQDIQAIRQKNGWTVEQFAKAVGVTRQTVHNWMSGKTEPSGPALKLLEIIRKS